MCPPGADQQANIDGGQKARNKEIAGGVVTTIGVAGLAGGLIWFIAAPRVGTSGATAAGTFTRPRVDAAVSPGFTGFALSGAF
jgi:hypothetical protein